MPPKQFRVKPPIKLEPPVKLKNRKSKNPPDLIGTPPEYNMPYRRIQPLPIGDNPDMGIVAPKRGKRKMGIGNRGNGSFW